MAALADLPFLFEVSWEVCNQVGGIYTVIRTKAPSMLSRLGNNYILLGPYNPENAMIEFEETAPEEPLLSALSDLSQQGIKGHYGRWLIQGRPQVVLFDFRARFSALDSDKYFLWTDHGIPAPRDDFDVNNAVAFGCTVAEFFRLFVQYASKERPIVAHFHEWLVGIAIPRMRLMKLPIATIFTTHATILGRYIASDNPRFYSDLQHINPHAAAKHYNIESRFLIKRTAAHAAHIFTTISDVTAQESEKLLGRKPSHILPNGLNIDRFMALHEFQNLHNTYKERINEFVMGHFFPSYTFDLERTLYFFTSGRYEYRNKGMDMYLEALFRLNQRLKETENPPTIVAFIVTKAPIRSISIGALQRHSMLEDLKTICQELETSVSEKILLASACGRLPGYEELLPHDFQVRLKRAIHARRNSELPSIVTHDLADSNTDPVIKHLRHRGLFNAPCDPVKVVFHPDFITANSPFFNLDYDHFVRGCHLGVFPSYYEPWGYTPLECLALGIPAITTDLTGFGNFSMHNIPRLTEQGLHVLRRADKGPDDCIEELTTSMLNFTRLSRRERIELRNKAERLSDLFDWSKLSAYYHEAHKLAVELLAKGTV
jgi:glycogen synthase